MNTSCKLVQPFALRRGTPVPVVRGWFDMSIDPGLSTGWALWSAGEGEALVACGVGAPPFDEVERLVRVAVETPQSYPSSPVPPQDLVTLAFQAGTYAQAAGSAKVYTLFPHAWKGNLPKDVCEQRVRLRLTQEELTLVTSCEALVPKKQMHNVWDAIGIGLFAFRDVRL